MAGNGTDRKVKSKDAKSVTNEMFENLAAFKLPDSLSCSKIEFPIIVSRKCKAKWINILEESNKFHQEIEEYVESKREPARKPPFLKTEYDYIKNDIFIYLIPVLEETLIKAEMWNALKIQKCFFNGIDHIAQTLWNNNPRYPERKMINLHLFNMPWVREHLKKAPRPYYPKSWLWSEEHAATLIQKTVRQYFVQRGEDVQEMRQFWKKLATEGEHPEIEINPYLSKKFASQQHILKK